MALSIQWHCRLSMLVVNLVSQMGLLPAPFYASGAAADATCVDEHAARRPDVRGGTACACGK